MTTKILIVNHSPGNKPVRVHVRTLRRESHAADAEVVRGARDEGAVVAPGCSHEAWVHSGQSIEIDETE